ncbi:hypothetical protein HGRIS_002220 [Hohenbuehelia grisea]|uniref:Uncharacterized protein n=1 Tax=Hohenbuehelia grisea TaxID=104357 RepID=A0ABR3JL80_9AGAR
MFEGPAAEETLACSDKVVLGGSRRAVAVECVRHDLPIFAEVGRGTSATCKAEVLADIPVAGSAAAGLKGATLVASDLYLQYQGDDNASGQDSGLSGISLIPAVTSVHESGGNDEGKSTTYQTYRRC